MGKLIRRPRKKSRFSPITQKCQQKNSLLRQNSNNANNFDNENSPQKCGDINLCHNDFKTAVEKITSNYSEDRLAALKILASMPANKKNLKKFQDYNCMEHVSPLMTSSPTQLQATQFVSKLLHADAFKVSDALVFQIFKILCPVLKNFTVDDLSGNSNQMEIGSSSEMIEEKIESFSAIVRILSRLCELNQKVMLKVNEEDLLSFLFKFTDSRQFGYQVTLAVLHCLLCVTEMNDSANDSVPEQQFIDRISQQPDDYHDIYHTTLVAGILVNVGSSDVNLINPVFGVLSHTISVDILSACNDVSKSPNTVNAAKVESLLSAQKLAMEVLANVCYINDDCSEEDDYTDDMNMEIDNSDCIDDDINLVKSVLKQYNMVEMVLAKATMPLDNLDNIEVMQKKLYNKVNSIKTRAVMCLVNLCSFLNCEDADSSQILYNIFSHLGTSLLSISSKADPADEILLRDLSIAMRAVVKNLCAGKCRQLFSMSTDDLKGIFELSKNPIMKTPLSQVIGTLSCFYIENFPEADLYSCKQHEFFEAVTNHLLQMASDSARLPDCAEALDIIIDVYSDDKTDILAAQLNLVSRLRIIQKQFMVALRKQRKRLGTGEHWPLIQTVKDNLLNFIEHKSARISMNKQIST